MSVEHIFINLNATTKPLNPRHKKELVSEADG